MLFLGIFDFSNTVTTISNLLDLVGTFIGTLIGFLIMLSLEFANALTFIFDLLYDTFSLISKVISVLPPPFNILFTALLSFTLFKFTMAILQKIKVW